MRVGVIGTGLIAELAHLPGYQAAGAQIVAVADVVEERAQRVAKKFGIPETFKDYQDLLKLPEIEAVSVCVPNFLHHSIVLDALKAGKHVLVEKPMAINLSQAQEMEEAAKKAGRLLMVGFNSRFRSDVQKLRKVVEAGQLGDIYFAKTGYMRRRGYPSGWFTVKREAGGGPVVDIAIHAIDFTRYLVGSPKPVSVVASVAQKFGACPVEGDVWQSSDVREGLRDGKEFDVEDFASAWIRFDNGLVMTVETAWTANIPRDRVYSDLLGTLSGAGIDSYHSVHKKGSGHGAIDEAVEIYGETSGMVSDTLLPFRANDSHAAEIRHFLAVIQGKEEPIMSAHDGVIMQGLLDAIYQSAEKRREIVL